jgi:hypothetical protein
VSRAAWLVVAMQVLACATFQAHASDPIVVDAETAICDAVELAGLRWCPTPEQIQQVIAILEDARANQSAATVTIVFPDRTKASAVIPAAAIDSHLSALRARFANGDSLK